MIQPSSKPLTGLAPRISPPRWMSSRRPTGGPAFCERLRRAMSLSEYFRHHQKLHFCRDSCDKQQDLGIAFFQTTATDVCVCVNSPIFLMPSQVHQSLHLLALGSQADFIYAPIYMSCYNLIAAVERNQKARVALEGFMSRLLSQSGPILDTIFGTEIGHNSSKMGRWKGYWRSCFNGSVHDGDDTN